MIKRFIFIVLILSSVYLFVLSIKLNMSSVVKPRDINNVSQTQETDAASTQKVYSFSFSKYTTEGHRELEIEGDSADIFSQVVKLTNVIAKAYANEKPITITADKGVFDKETSLVHLKENVVATSEEGATLRSESLDIDVAKKKLETEDRAKVEKDNMQLEGDGAVGLSDLKKIKFKKNVTVVISPEDKEASPTVITCDGQLEVDYMNNIAHFNDNVVATDAKGKLTADEMDVFYDKSSRRVYKIIARGNVIIEQEGNVTYSDSVVYLAREGRVILGGDPEALYYPESEPFKGADNGEQPYLLFDAMPTGVDESQSDT